MLGERQIGADLSIRIIALIRALRAKGPVDKYITADRILVSCHLDTRRLKPYNPHVVK
jgi:hypothetical protein